MPSVKPCYGLIQGQRHKSSPAACPTTDTCKSDLAILLIHRLHNSSPLAGTFPGYAIQLLKNPFGFLLDRHVRHVQYTVDHSDLVSE